jgi:hypothetical protein
VDGVHHHPNERDGDLLAQPNFGICVCVKVDSELVQLFHSNGHRKIDEYGH